MKISIHASAIAVAFAMSIGSASAEEQNSVVNDNLATPAIEQFSMLKDIPSAIPMTDEQLDETVGAGEYCEPEIPQRRRWFNRGGGIQT